MQKYVSFLNGNRTVRIKILKYIGGMFPHFFIFAKQYEDKINNYSGYSAMQMGLLYKPCKDRETERQRKRSGAITTRLLSINLIYIRNNFIKINWDTLLDKYRKYEQTLALRWLIWYRTWKKPALEQVNLLHFISDYINHLNTLLLCKQLLFSVMLINNHNFSWDKPHLK